MVLVLPGLVALPPPPDVVPIPRAIIFANFKYSLD
jgi:hypothetical protein